MLANKRAKHNEYSRTQPCKDLHMLRPQQLLLATQALYEPHTSLTRASQEPYTILKKRLGPHQDIVDELLILHLFYFNARTYLRNGHVVVDSTESYIPQWPRILGAYAKMQHVLRIGSRMLVWSSIEDRNLKWPRTLGSLCRDDKQTETS